MKYQLHPYLGVEMLRKFPHIPEEVLDVIRSHHERLDGSGYPEKLKGIRFPPHPNRERGRPLRLTGQ